MLKKNNIRNIVISPGTRNTALVHSAQNDNYFNCYSVVDERSAGFFALGLSESLNEPVCVTCTAATATCNYMPAMKEAFERNIPVVALTDDQDVIGPLLWLRQREIVHFNMFKELSKTTKKPIRVNSVD